MSAGIVDYPLEMTRRLYSLRHDPLGAVLYGFPWGSDDLAKHAGPRKWQREVLDYIGAWFADDETRDKVCRIAISSGHGTGKTTCAVFVGWWSVSTFLDAMVRCTADTQKQLETVMYPEFDRWFRCALNADDFNVQVSSIKAADPKHDSTWRIDLMPWSEQNPQAFAGKHNAGRRMVVLIEEASEVSDEIFRVANGALTDADTEKLFVIIGNPTRNTGYFYDAVWGVHRDRWKSWILDSREVEGANIEEINGWLAECEGNEDADYFRVRARGLYPKGATGQYIDLDTIRAAQQRSARSLRDEPLIAGCDFAWGGPADNVIRFRKGYDARSISPVRVKGEFTRDPAVMRGKIAEVLAKTYNGNKVAMMFCDSAGIAGPVVAQVRALGFSNILEVNFGADSPDPKAVLWRDCMWMRLHDWLPQGAIDLDPGLAADLAKPQLIYDSKQRIKLEPKELMMKRLARKGIDASSPDDADALALTFAMPVAMRETSAYEPEPHIGVWS